MSLFLTMRIRKKINDSLNWVSSRMTGKNAVLLYHRVDEKEHDYFNLCVTPENFDQQMAVLAESDSVIPLREMVESHRNNQLETGKISITFDDGYLDVLDNALPILEKYQLPATLFVTTGNLGTPFWWDTLAAIIRQPAELPDAIAFETPAGSITSISTRTGNREAIFDAIYQTLRQDKPAHRLETLEILHRKICPNLNLIVQRAATEEELEAAAESPLLTLEAHTITHSRLSCLSYREQISEISNSIDHVSRITGGPVTSFSYPFGLKNRDYNEETFKAVRSAGLDHAFAADLGVITRASPALALPRIWAHNFSSSRFKRQLRLWLGSTSPETSLATA